MIVKCVGIIFVIVWAVGNLREGLVSSVKLLQHVHVTV